MLSRVFQLLLCNFLVSKRQSHDSVICNCRQLFQFRVCPTIPLYLAYCNAGIILCTSLNVLLER